VHAFFHLHWVHHSSRCSIPYTLRHFFVSPRSFLVGLPGNLLGADIDRSWLLLDWWCAWVPVRGLSFRCFWGELYKHKANVTCCDEVDKEHSLDNLIALTADCGLYQSIHANAKVGHCSTCKLPNSFSMTHQCLGYIHTNCCFLPFLNTADMYRIHN